MNEFNPVTEADIENAQSLASWAAVRVEKAQQVADAAERDLQKLLNSK